VKPNRSWIGVLSTLSIASLLVVAAIAPRAIGRAPALPGVLAHPSCDLILQQSDGNEALPLNYREGVVQPIAPPANVAACSLTVDPTYSYGFAHLNLVQWDPVSLMPDPATVALRTVSFSASPNPWNPTRAEFYPPVVTKSLPNVAERPGPVCLDLTGLRSADEAGLEALRSLRAHGVAVIGATPYFRLLLGPEEPRKPREPRSRPGKRKGERGRGSN